MNELYLKSNEFKSNRKEREKITPIDKKKKKIVMMIGASNELQETT